MLQNEIKSIFVKYLISLNSFYVQLSLVSGINIIFAVTEFIMPIYKQIAEFIGQKDNVGTLPRVECPSGKDSCTAKEKIVKQEDADVLKQLVQKQYDKIRSTY